MVKIQVAFIVALALTCTFCQTDAQRARYTRQRTRYLARQESEDAAPAAVTPYPSADELKPEVPFEEAVPVPDEVYGPPEATEVKPDEVYGPPEVSGNDLPAADAADPAAEPFPAPLDDQQARLVAARRQRQRLAAYRQAVAYRQAAAAYASRPAPAKLRASGAQRRYA